MRQRYALGQASQDELMDGVEKSLRKYFGKRSEQVVQDNLTAVRRGYSEVLEIPRAIVEQEEQITVETNGRLVRDVMHSGVVACHIDTPLPKLVRAMADQQISAVVVVDKDGFLEGLVSSTEPEGAVPENRRSDWLYWFTTKFWVASTGANTSNVKGSFTV